MTTDDLFAFLVSVYAIGLYVMSGKKTAKSGPALPPTLTLVGGQILSTKTVNVLYEIGSVGCLVGGRIYVLRVLYICVVTILNATKKMVCDNIKCKLNHLYQTEQG